MNNSFDEMPTLLTMVKNFQRRSLNDCAKTTNLAAAMHNAVEDEKNFDDLSDEERHAAVKRTQSVIDELLTLESVCDGADDFIALKEIWFYGTEECINVFLLEKSEVREKLPSLTSYLASIDPSVNTLECWLKRDRATNIINYDLSFRDWRELLSKSVYIPASIAQKYTDEEVLAFTIFEITWNGNTNEKMLAAGRELLEATKEVKSGILPEGLKRVEIPKRTEEEKLQQKIIAQEEDVRELADTKAFYLELHKYLSS